MSSYPHAAKRQTIPAAVAAHVGLPGFRSALGVRCEPYVQRLRRFL